MEGPGGYQFVGRTVQMWNTYRSTKEFEPGSPWLLRFFDQIRFEPGSAEKLLDIRDAFPYGRYPLRIEYENFRLREYRGFLSSTGKEAAAFRQQQEAAFVAERERWAASGNDQFVEQAGSDAPASWLAEALPEGCQPILSPVAASVWKIAVEAGQRVEAGQKLVVLEAMKMEIAVVAPASGIVERLDCGPGTLVSAGQHLETLRGEAGI